MNLKFLESLNFAISLSVFLIVVVKWTTALLTNNKDMKNLKSGLLGIFMLLAITTIAQQKQGNGGQKRAPEDQAKNMIERLDKQLKLSQNQKDSIYIYAYDLAKKQQDLFKSTDDRKAAFEKIQPIRLTTDLKIKSFLTSEQSKSYDILQKQMQERRQQRQK